MAVSEPDLLPRLPARLAELPGAVLTGHADLLRQLATALRGPYHVVLPEQFDANVCAFQSTLDERDVEGRIYYAKKANKAACWVERSAEQGIGVDVASVGELRDALGHGVRGEQLVVTGPAKAEELLRLAILHRSLITVDALDELKRCAELAGRLGSARILLRCLPDDQRHSRFGMDEDEIDRALGHCARARAVLRLEGFSSHLSGHLVQPRAAATARMIRLCAQARDLGVPADSVSIGGGLAVDYVDSESWQRFRPDPEYFHAGRTFGDFYPYHSPVAGPAALGSMLDTVPPGENTDLACLLRGSGVTLLLEPGRALLDQAGCTVFRVQGVKERDYGIVTADGTSMSLSEQWFNSEFLPDPVLLPGETRNGDRHEDGPFAACVGGASCLESDLLTWRKVAFPARPRTGDLLVYPNTAGYQMDSNESEFHELPLPPKVVLVRDGDSVRWWLDRPPS